MENKPEEVDATPDEAFDLGEVAGFDEGWAARGNLPGLVYLATDGTQYRVDQIADQWFRARREHPEASFYHDVEGRDQALLRGLIALVSAWLDDPGAPRP